MKLIQATLALCMAAAVSAAPYGPPASTIVKVDLEYASMGMTAEAVTLTKGQPRPVDVPDEVAAADPDRYFPATTYTITHPAGVGQETLVTRTYTLDADGFYFYK